MKIGIIVYSKTGNTLQVAERIAAKLTKMGEHVEIQRFTAEEESAQSSRPVRLHKTPNPNLYDALIIGSPVKAFSLDPAMTMYLQQAAFTNQVPTFCFLTQYFKKPWMGGNHAMKQLLSQLSEKGITAQPLGIVNWSNAKREAQINKIVEQSVTAIRGKSE